MKIAYDGPERRKPNGEHRLVAEAAVERVLKTYGVDVEHPLEVQADHAWTRRRRVSEEQVGKVAKRTAVAVVVTGIITTAWLVLKDHVLK